MARDLTVFLDDTPGSLATMAESLGTVGINIDGLCGVAGSARGEIHVLVEDADAARSALTEVGIEVGDDVEIVTTVFDDRPGELGQIARRVADTGANIELVYVSCDRRLVLVTSDNTATAEALG